MTTTPASTPAPKPLLTRPALDTPEPNARPSLLDRMADATPATRDRTVDFLRACCIAMVVAWHWMFSMNHWSAEGTLSMPNPLHTVPGGWALTWVLQVMPLFFVIGGFANRAAWTASKAKGGTRREFAVGRLGRMGVPVAIMAVAWAVLDGLLTAAFDSYRSVLTWGVAVFVPLWFLGIYLAISAISSWTVDAFDRHPLVSVGVLGSLVVVADVARFALELPFSTYLNTALVFLFAHQLGHGWNAGWFAGDPSPARRLAAMLTAAGLAMLVVSTTFGPYSSSMVAVSGEGVSNMNPTTAPIAALAVFQLGLVGLAQPKLEQLCAKRGIWKATIAINAVAMTVFTWHMTALAAVMALATAVGVSLSSEATLGWWLTRPIWVALPGLVLAALLVMFARFELPSGDRA